MTQPTKPDILYGIDDVPPLAEALTLGFQHYLTMFGSTVAIPLIVAGNLGMTDPADIARLISTMFFVSGITTLLQTTWGNRLPLVQGGTFSFIAPVAAICAMPALAQAGWEVKLAHVQGAVIAASLAEIAIGYFGLVGRLLRFVGPITIAPTIALIGLTLFAFGTSLPELAASVVAAYRGHPDVAIGNVVGSNIFNMMLVGGIVAIVKPIPVPDQVLNFDIWVMLAATVMLLPVLLGWMKLDRKYAFLFFLIYIGYVGVQAYGVERLLASI